MICQTQLRAALNLEKNNQSQLTIPCFSDHPVHPRYILMHMMQAFIGISVQFPLRDFPVSRFQCVKLQALTTCYVLNWGMPSHPLDVFEHLEFMVIKFVHLNDIYRYRRLSLWDT